jgi:glycosyltransferase involved in cell wall biosynthesis
VKVMCLIDSLAPGGAESSLAALAPEFPDRGIELEIAYLKERDGLQPRFEESGVPLFSLAVGKGRPGWIAAARRLIAERSPDLVHTTLFESDIAGRVAGWSRRVPVVSSLVNVEYGPEQFSDPRLSAARLRACHAADAVTARAVARWHAITHHVAQVMAGRLKLRGDRIDVVPRGRDPKMLGERNGERRKRARQTLAVQPNCKLILAAARQEHQKGLDVLLEAMPRIVGSIPEARLVIAGREGNQTAQLRQLIEGLRLRDKVELLGTRTDVPDLMCAADVFVFPSRFEGLGSVLIEAMALEVPIVASALPAVVETVRPSADALVVPPENPTELAAEIVETLGEPDVAASRARSARRRFLEHYTIAAVADGMQGFYERALAGKRGRRSSNQVPRPREEAPFA